MAGAHGGGPVARRGAAGGDRRGPRRAGRAVLPELRLLHAVPAGDRDPQLRPDGYADPPQPVAAIFHAGVAGEDEQNQRLHRVRTLQVEVPLRPRHPERAKIYAEGLLGIL